MKQIITSLFLGLLVALPVAAQQDVPYDEPYRSQYHFSPAQGWVGDPCGFIHYQNKYHLYWWGKAESTDLVHYKEVTPRSLADGPENIGYFTGSLLIDKENTAGFGEDAFIAVYTAFEKDSKKQAQGISFSRDGKTFRYYDRNPVLDIWSTEFRDPTVFWHEPTRKWVMVVAKALEKKIQFYTSTDLKQWTWVSDFGPAGDREKSWECPDLFQLSVDGDSDNKRWVMVVSINWAQVQYFVGDFDGTSFQLMKNHPSEPLYVDCGLDYYAPRTFRDYDYTLTTTTAMGWVATWDYAPLAPSTYGKGFWSIPRNLNLKTFAEGIRMTQQPVEQLQTLRGQPVSICRSLVVGTHQLEKFVPKENVYELDATFSTDVSNTFGLNLCVGDGRKVTISYDTDSHQLLIDRTHCSNVSITKFNRMAYAQVEPIENKIRMRLFVDKSSVELFTNDGKEVFSLLTYPGETQTGIELFALKKGTRMELKGWVLNSVWR